MASTRDPLKVTIKIVTFNYLLGRCHIDGNGVLQDENIGIMWLAKAAAHGHAVSQAQMQAMLDKFTK